MIMSSFPLSRIACHIDSFHLTSIGKMHMNSKLSTPFCCSPMILNATTAMSAPHVSLMDMMPQIDIFAIVGPAPRIHTNRNTNACKCIRFLFFFLNFLKTIKNKKLFFSCERVNEQRATSEEASPYSLPVRAALTSLCILFSARKLGFRLKTLIYVFRQYYFFLLSPRP